MNEILLKIREEGYQPDQVTPDGQIHRFKSNESDNKKSAWAIVYQNHTRKGEMFYFAMYSHWGSFEQPKIYHTLKGKISAEDKKYIQKQTDDSSKKIQVEKELNQKEVAKEVQALWEKLNPTGTHEYLIKKQISDCPDLGVKFDSFKGEIYVPVRDELEVICSYQRILKERDGKFDKRFATGGRVAGCSHVIGAFRDSNPKRVLLTEGFSTGASISLATSEPVVVCFSAGNLESVAIQYSKKFPESNIIICGDDDRFKEPNTGRIAALSAAKTCRGIAIFPAFDGDGKGTDFNDLHFARGLEEVRNQINAVEIAPREKMTVYALGHKEKEYFFTSTSNQQIVAITSFTKSDFLNLMPLEYWETVFPGKTGPSWDMASSQMMIDCRTKGIFNGKMVRGAGTWIDDSRVVINMGDHLVVDGKTMAIRDIDSRYFYTIGKRLKKIHAKPMEITDCYILIKACVGFKWLNEDFGKLLAGALVTNRICGALPIRPHLWITGGAATGKTTLLEKLIHPILGESKLYVQGVTTEAGLRQSLKADAIPVLFDEFETTGDGSAERIAACIELLRSAWSESGAVIIKGGTSGNASHFQVRTSAIVSSIRTGLRNDADISRFNQIELAEHGSDEKHWEKLSELLSQIDEEYSERLFARTSSMIPILLCNFKTIKKILSKRAGSRFADQHGMLMAGFSILIYDQAMTEEQSIELVDYFDLKSEREASKVKDEFTLLDHILTSKISYDGANGKRDGSIGELIEFCQKDLRSGFTQDCGEKNALLRIGIRVDLNSVSIAQSNHAEIERLLRGTRWVNSWGRSLGRLPGAQKNQNAKILGSQKTCVTIPHKTA